jgi:hypothetical protein
MSNPTEQPMTAVEALLQFARAHTDEAAAQALLDEATRELTSRTVVRPGQQLASRRFVLRRHHDVSGISGLGDVADGVLWPDGTASIRWRGEHPSVVHWDRGRLSVEHIHGHQGATEIVWLDEDDIPPAVSTPTGAAATVPTRVRRILDHALRRPVPCPKCRRVTACRCGADRTDARAAVVLGALAPWLPFDGSEAA